MTPDEVRANVEAAWLIAKSSDSAVRALLILVNEEHAMMLWQLGYGVGANDAYDRAKAIMERQA